VVEAGAFDLRLGVSSHDLRYTVRVELPGDGTTLTLGRDDPGRSDAARPNVVNGPGQYTVDTPLGNLRHPLARALLTLLTRIGRRVVRADPIAATIDQSVAGTPVRMLPMATDGRLRPGFARWLVRVANRGEPVGRSPENAPSRRIRWHWSPSKVNVEFPSRHC
jgi:hypothetical protein